MAKNKIKLTKKQLRCTTETSKSLAILAGAGSGKTAVLIDRIKNIVTSGRANFSEIVAITFTEKAAGELIYRLTEEIPSEFRPQIEQATVATIDGFCTKILREDAAAIGINPDFNILEEHASRIMNHRIISSVLKELLRDGDPEAERVVEEMEYRYAVSCLEDLVENRWYCIKHSDPRSSILDPSNLQTQNPASSIEHRASRTQRLLQSIFSCLKKVLDNIETEKHALGTLDFVDLEILTLELLNNPEIQRKYQSRIKHLLIDEYQDTSDLQTEIVKRLFNPKKNILCIVGDPGQSIYRFRGANPEGINEMREIIEGSGGQTIKLTENFRSSAPVVEFVNKIFTSPVIASPKGEAIQSTGLLRRSTPRNDTREDHNHFLPLEAKTKSSANSKVAKINIDVQELSAEEAREKEAQELAGLILSLKNENNYSYADFALLFRSFSDIGIYEKALNRVSIPYYRSGGRTLLNQPEVADIILCMKVLADPANDTLSYGLARSTIAGLSDEECYKLFTRREKPIFEILSSNSSFNFLKHLVSIKNYLSISEIIREIASTSNLYKVFESIQSSGQPTANIEKLITIADSLSLQYDYSLEDFIEYIDDLKLRGVGIGEPPIFGTRDNAVKLLTIHAAKGLEFGVVILADLLRADRNHTLPYIIDKKSGLGFKLRKGDNPIAEKEKTPLFEELSERDKERDNLEKERLLYVASTRAKETLIIPDFNRSSKKAVWQKLLDPHVSQLQQLKLTIDKPSHEIKINEPISPPVVSTPTMRERVLTVSHLESYHRCPQEYYLKYVMKVPAELIKPRTNKMGANTIGNIVHKSIQIASLNRVAGWKDIIPIVAHEYGYPNLNEKDLKIVECHLINYEKSPFFDKKLDGARHETPFLFKINSASIKGTIDCIYNDNGGYSIVDFKTDRAETPEEIKKKRDEYELQIMTYAIAAKKSLNKPINKIALLFLHSGETEEMKLDEKHFTRGYEMIHKISDSIFEGDFDIKGKETPCNKCPYHQNRTCWLDKLTGNNG